MVGTARRAGGTRDCPRLAVAPDLVLRQLDPAALGDDGERIIDGLRPLYEAITAGAAALALGEESEES